MSNKLKGIYDALDHGNWKNALKLCSTFLQKQQGHALCRALHAVALERCGRTDEAIQVVQETVAAGATAAGLAALDDTTLNTLQVILRRSREWESIVQMYEAAWNREADNEEFACSLFFASLRQGDCNKAQQVATKIYRKFNKPHFLQWVIASILLQVRAGGNTKSLDLAAMMLQKAPMNMEALKTESVTFDRGQLYLLMLHLSTLQMQKKQEQALELLEACKPLVKLPSDVAALKVQLRCEAGQLKEAVKEARTQVIASPGSWAAVQEYARLVVALAADGADKSRCSLGSTVPEVATLEDVEKHATGDEAWNALLLFRHFQQVQETGISSGGGSGVNRVAFLGELELRRTVLAQAEMETSKSPSPDEFKDIIGVMTAFIERFAGRTHCFFDLKPYLALLSAADMAPLHVAASNAEGREALVLASRLRRATCRVEEKPASLEKEASEASELLSAWAKCRGEKRPAPEALLQLAVVAVLEMDRTCCLQEKAGGRRYVLDAIALAELGLKEDEHAFAFKVLLLALYSALGLPNLMTTRFGTMDIKNIQHESLSYLVLDELSSTCGLEGLKEVCQNIKGFHEDLDKDGSDALVAAFNKGVLPRAPEYIDSLTQVGHSLMWGRAVIEEALLDAASATSWEVLVESLSRQARLVASIAGKSSEHWVLRNQDRALLNGLQPLELLTPACSVSSTGAGQLRARPRSVSSFALTWGDESSNRPIPKLCRGRRGAAEELLHAGLEGQPAAELRLSASALQLLSSLVHKEGASEDVVTKCMASARESLVELFGGNPPELSGLAAAAAALAEDAVASSSSSWSPASNKFRAMNWCCGVAACEMSELVLRCCSGKEAWEKVVERLDCLAATVKGIVECLRHQAPGAGFSPPPRDGTASGSRPFGIGCFETPGLWSLLSCCLSLLIPVALWCTTALPKAGGKKVKEGQEALHSARLALRNLLQALQASLGDLQGDVSGAVSEELPAENSDLPEVSSLSAAPGFPELRKEAQTAVLDAHRKQLKALQEALGQRITLLKSRGSFKP